jgi:hypothetical protein
MSYSAIETPLQQVLKKSSAGWHTVARFINIKNIWGFKHALARRFWLLLSEPQLPFSHHAFDQQHA